jgi:hypothetical protein
MVLELVQTASSLVPSPGKPGIHVASIAMTLATSPSLPSYDRHRSCGSVRARARCQASGLLKRSFLEEFYVICGSFKVTVTLTNPLLIMATHYLIKHHHVGSLNYAAAACSFLEAVNSHKCRTRLFSPQIALRVGVLRPRPLRRDQSWGDCMTPMH